MRMSCIHCGQAFSITAEQLGGKGRCPHCRGSIRLPDASQHEDEVKEKAEPSHLIQNSMSGLLSLVFHMVLILVLALISYGASGGAGLGEEVLIGTLPTESLGDSQEKELEAAEVMTESQSDFDESLDVEPPTLAETVDSDEDYQVVAAASGGSEASAFEIGAMTMSGSPGGGDSWDGMLQSLRQNGLDIVITFDSTGSMMGEIDQVKRQIKRIGSTLMTLVPQKTRISICTYRDQGDEYVVRGLPLTDDLQAVDTYLSGIIANAGGDEPEAVHEGLRWSIEENGFRPRARKVILLFGDAPPHPEHLAACLRLASDFHGEQKGTVSTVTCRAVRPLPSFAEIAEVGGGEAFVTADERQIMTQLVILVFGSRYREKVLEAFKLMEGK